MLPRLVVSCLFVSSLTAADWPQWLGPNRDGKWCEDGILEKFPAGGPKVLWRKPINGGYTGPAVASGKVFVMDRVLKNADAGTGPTQGTERVLCLDHGTGETVWTHEYERAYRNVDRPLGPRTTPVVDGDRVYTLGSMGDLYCLDTRNGKPVWNKYFPDDFKAKPPVWGHSAHLLVHGDLVISLVGGDGSAVVAFDKMTGVEKWRALSSPDVGYSPPVIAEFGGKKQLIVWLSNALAGLNPDNGTVLWRHLHPRKGMKQMTPAVTIITPKVVGDIVYISSAYDGGLAVKLHADKPAEIVWQASDNYPKKPGTIAVLMTTLIAKSGHLFGLDANTGEMLCVEAATAKEIWRSNKLFGRDALFGSAFWVEQGDRIFCFTDAGDLVILKANPKHYEEIDRVHVMDPVGSDRGRKVVWSHPAFAGKTMTIRNEKEIINISLAG